jgi:hypothetical protein
MMILHLANSGPAIKASIDTDMKFGLIDLSLNLALNLTFTAFCVLLCACGVDVNNRHGMNPIGVDIDSGLTLEYRSLYYLEDRFSPDVLSKKYPEDEPTFIQSMGEQGSRVDLELQRVLANNSGASVEELLKGLALAYGVTSYYCRPPALGGGRPKFPVSTYAMNAPNFLPVELRGTLKYSALAKYQSAEVVPLAEP